jgi:SNF2 family DNA or RNA helicase
MAEAVLVGNIIEVSFPYNENRVRAIKQIPKHYRSFDPDTKAWSVDVRAYPLLAKFFPSIRIQALEDGTHQAEQATKHPTVAKLVAQLQGSTTERFLGGTKLMHHQAVGAKILERRSIGLFFDTGTGKTLTVLSAIETLMPLKVLVVCPLALLEDAWREDVNKFCPQLPLVNLHALTQLRRTQALTGFNSLAAGIAAINFESFKTLEPLLMKWGPDLLVIDESSKMKSPKTQITKALLRFGEKSGARVACLSGTPAPNSEEEYYTQLKVLGAEVPASFYAWRDELFDSAGYGGFKFILRADKKSTLKDQLASVAWHVHKDDVLDLPERTFTRRSVKLSKPEKQAYADMKEHMVAELMDEYGDITTVSVNMILQKIGKLRQMTSGFSYVDGETVQIGDSKARALVDLLEEIGNHQVVIWAHYKEEYRMIREAIDTWTRTRQEIKDPTVDPGVCVEYHGGIPRTGDTRHNILQRFKLGNAQYLIASPQSIGHGVNLTQCSYMTWFSASHSYEQHHQCNDRIYRKGQRNACTYFHLVADTDLDPMLLDVVSNKANRSRTVLDFLKGAG